MMSTASMAAATMPARRSLFDDLPEISARFLTGALFLVMAWRLGDDFLRTWRPTVLLMLVGEAAVVVLTCFRRYAVAVDRRPLVRAVTTISILFPMLVWPSSSSGLIREWFAATMAGFGLLMALGGKLSIGYSFGLLPANRGVKDTGMYRLVRHPIYLGYLLTHLSFLLAHPTAWNFGLLMAGDIALIVRAFYEEQMLLQDPAYVRYCQQVRWRLLPGLC